MFLRGVHFRPAPGGHEHGPLAGQHEFLTEQEPEPLGELSVQRPIDARETIIQIAVSDISRSRRWYSQLFGKGPDLEPFPGNVEFKVGGAWVQIVGGTVRPSSWSILFEVRDLAWERERLRGVGIPAIEI